MGTGYTRNDTTNNIADGNVINAADLDGEFDAIVTALSTGGHTHDGTAAEGGPVTVLGPAQDFVVSASIVSPKTDNTLDLGTSTLEFKDLYIDGTAYIDGLGEDLLVAGTSKIQFRDTDIHISSATDGHLDLVADTEIHITATTINMDGAADISGNLGVGGNLTVTGTTTFNGGTITLGDAAADNVVFGADVDSSIIPDDGDTYDLGSSGQQWRDIYIDGSAYIDGLAEDILVATDKKIQFRDTGLFINSSTNGQLDIDADVELEITAPTVDINASTAVLISNDLKLDSDAAVLGFGVNNDVTLTHVHDTALLLNDAIALQFRDSALAINSSADGQLDIIADVSLEITTPILNFDTDGQVINFGAGDDVKITHVHNSGLTFTNTNTSDNTPIVLQLKSEENELTTNEVIASIEFAAGDDSGTDAATIAAGIHAIAEAEFTSSANATKLVFTTGVSETAAASATAKMTLSSAGLLTIADDFMLKDGGTIGVASTNDAITIASTGIVTFKDDILIKDAGTIGSASDPDAIAISSGGVVAISATTAASSSTSGALTVAGGAGIAADLHVGDDLVVTGDATFNGDTHTFASTNSQDPLLIIKNTTNDANGSRLHFVKDKGAAGADGDDIGIIEFISDDADQAQTSFAKIVAEVSESLGGDEAGKLSFFVAESDSTTTALTAGLVIEGEHATDGEVDVTIAAGANSTTTVAGDLAVTTDATVGGTLGVTGVVTANAGVVVDNITIDGTEIDLSSGNLTIDVAGYIIIDSDDGNIYLNDGGSGYGQISGASQNLTFKSSTSDKDMIFQGNDGGASITALTLDMSDAGTATFNHDVKATGNFDLPNANTFITGAGHNVVQVDSTRTYFYGGTDGVQFRTADNSAENISFSNTGAAVFNEQGNDADFRIETDAQASAFVLDAADDTLTITNVPTTMTHGGNGYQLKLESTDADGSRGPVLDLSRNNSSAATNDQVGCIIFTADDSANNQTEYASITAFLPDVTNTSEAGGLIFDTATGGNPSIEKLRLGATEATFNTDSANIDFRVVSDGNASMLFVDGGANFVNIGSATDWGGALNVYGGKSVGSGIPSEQLTVVDDTSFAAGVGGALLFKGGFTSGGITEAGSLEAYKANATDGHYGFGLMFKTRTHGGTNDERLFMDEDITVFNDLARSTDFRVESVNNANMLFVDASADTVQLGTTLTFGGVVNVKSSGIGVGESGSSGSYRRMYWNDSNNDLRFWNGSNEGIINSSGAFVDASDVNLKKDIADIEYGIDTVKSLKPRKYKMKDTNVEQIGFVAQEIETQVPEVVSTGITPDGDEQKGIAYGQLTAVLAKAIQEQQTLIEALTARITALES